MSGLVSSGMLLIGEPAGDLPAGVYVARSDDPAYGHLKSLVEDERAEYVGENRDPEGAKYIAVSVYDRGQRGMTPNGSIRIGREFFTTALRDYNDWQEKWWREAVQNAVDAGADRVELAVTNVPEGYAVSCIDNGRGMDEDTLVNKFLVLGGTTKVSGDTRGGFGKAKELLVLPWLAWSVHTRDRKVVGVGIDYTVEPAPMRQGTEVRVVMPPDQTTYASAALSFLEKCNLPGIDFTVDGKPVRARLMPREELRQFADGKATLYYDKKSTMTGLLVRTMGLYMFEMWVSGSVPGVLVVELHGSSIDLLTANRDGFRDRELKSAIERFVTELAADTSSALKKRKGIVHDKIRGTGKFRGAKEAEVRAEVFNHLQEVVPMAKTRRGPSLSDEQVTIISAVINRMGGGEGSELVPDEESGALNMRPTGELARAMLDATVLPGTTAIEAAVKQLSWEPDFYVINEVEGFHVPKMFYPEGMTPLMKKLARTWAELCRFVMIQLGCAFPFGVGFIFSESAQAAYLGEEPGTTTEDAAGSSRRFHEEDEHWLLLNPFRNPRRIGGEKPSKETLIGVVEEDDVNYLYALAIHEATHMADGISYHDESFSSALTRNLAKTANKDRQVKAIVKAIKARGPRPEGAARTPPRRAPGVAAIRPLSDEDIERERVSVARDYKNASPYVSFKNDRVTVWDYSSNLAALQKLMQDDSYGVAVTFEIRDTATGQAVWRSSNFDDAWLHMGLR